MRKEVKKLRVLIIRNLTQEISALKKVKAEESELKGHVERAARLQQEVQVLRTLQPDRVTTRALEGGIDAEKVLQDPESDATERAAVRIATHARFVKKLQEVRQAIEEEKMKAAKAGEEIKDVSKMRKAEDSDEDVEDGEKDEVAPSDDDDDVDGEEEKEEDIKVKNNIKTHETLKVIPSLNIKKPPEKIKLASAKEKPKSVVLEKAVRGSATPKSSSKPAVKAVQCLPSKSKEAAPPAPRPVSKPGAKQPETRKDKEESDLSDSEEEKEYFDDSTEERFHKQSSYSEQSDDDNDFFLGKVSKLKKKRSDTAPRPEKTNEPNKPRGNEVKETPQFKMQSVFCSTLSRSSTSSQKGKHHYPAPRSQNHDQKPSWGKNQGSGGERRPAGFKNQTPGSRGGDKTGKPAFDRKNAPINKVGKHSQQALHPSWEASRKRKEQQAQITAFQGKKIKFDDDDDD